jgi:beta-glucosidase
VVGEGAASLPLQTGGWSLTWQGTDNKDSDFPLADSILSGIVEANGKDKVVYSADASGVDVSSFDAVIAVMAESPYAEGAGDIGPAGTLRHSSRYPQDFATLRMVAGKGKPVITLLLSGRPLWVNDLMNLSDSFVAAWQPGTEGKGVADVLFKGGKPFTGTLSFSWPKSSCQATVNMYDKDYAPLFKVGYGLGSGERSHVGQLDAGSEDAGCGDAKTVPVWVRGDRARFPLAISSGGQHLSLGRDLHSRVKLPGIRVENGEVGPSQEGKRVTWTAAGRFEARAAIPAALPSYAATDGALRFNLVVPQAPSGAVKVGFGGALLDVTSLFAGYAGKGKQTVNIPLACFGAQGASLSSVDTPFAIESAGPFSATFGSIVISGGAAREANAVQCGDLK